MRSQELKVSPLSDYYVYAPSILAKKLYLYPVCVGYFIYEPDYHISRNSFDSFLIMYISKGSCDIMVNDCSYRAEAGQFVLLDCYVPHRYGSADAWEAAWLHFDGTLARDYYQEITSHYGNVLSPDNPKALAHSLDNICNYFRNSSPIIEPDISSHITSILNGLMVPAPENKRSLIHTHTVADTISYINEHFHEPIFLDVLADKANLSPFHFTRIFTRETGVTPHQYVISTRISAAKFMLKSSETSIKDIAFSTGFNSESSFCSTFKKWEKITPSQYRNNILGQAERGRQ